jgi:glycosyltransferase involved in cell wall biosynthesis
VTHAPLHIVANALPEQAGYTLRTHSLMLGQWGLGMAPCCFVLPAGELPQCDCVDAAGIGQSGFDGMSYYRFSEPNRFRRWLIRTTAYLRTRGVPGSWRFGATFREPPAPWLHLERWVRENAATTLVHAHTPYDCAAWGAHVARGLAVPWVYEVRGFWDLTEESAGRVRVNGIPANEWRRREIELAHQADALITLSETMRGELVQRGLPAERIHIVGNGVDTELFQPPAGKDQALQEQLNLGGRFVVGYITNVRPLEGIATMLDALCELKQRQRKVVFVLVGDGKDLSRLKEHSRRLGVDDSVRFVGRVPHRQIRRYYSLFDAFVVPRTDDPVCRLVTPMKPLEAMSMGIPVIVSDLPALRELIEPERTGFAFRAGDPSDLAWVIAGLADDPERARQVGREARGWVLRERDWSAIARRTLELYDNLKTETAKAGR